MADNDISPKKEKKNIFKWIIGFLVSIFGAGAGIAAIIIGILLIIIAPLLLIIYYAINLWFWGIITWVTCCLGDICCWVVAFIFLVMGIILIIVGVGFIIGGGAGAVATGTGAAVEQPRAYILTSWRWIREGETKGKTTFIATIRFNGNVGSSTTTPKYSWTVNYS